MNGEFWLFYAYERYLADHDPYAIGNDMYEMPMDFEVFKNGYYAEDDSDYQHFYSDYRGRLYPIKQFSNAN
jgi:hypothetical protein